MKKFVMLCAGAVIGICSLAVAQSQDTTSTNYNEQTTAPEQRNSTQSDEMKTNDAERADPQNTDQQLQQDVDAMEKNFEGSTIDKVGPNGEKLFMERGKYFYYDADGKKVKVKKSEVRDKSVGDNTKQ
ncbi:MAG TPA: hypothetical protein VE467_01785 [Chryseolinea sp.]|nr:hypothetical protein [Chryseolinea sp.]